MKAIDPLFITFAINNLIDIIKESNQVNYFKDYLMPIITVCISSATAYFIALKGFKYQETVKNEKSKADTSNQIILLFQSMQGSLAALKDIYVNELTDNPIQRALIIPMIPMKLKPVQIEPERLIQLFNLTNSNIEKEPWTNISAIMTTLNNYNHMITIIETRNSVNEIVINKLSPLVFDSKIEIEKIFKTIEPSLRIKYIDITEMMILFIDNLIVTVDDFLNHFPAIAVKNLNKKYIPNYIIIKNYQNNHTSFTRLLSRSTSVNIETLSLLVEMDEKMVKEKYTDQSFLITTNKDYLNKHKAE
ncbi:hypothetical protein [Pectobacterium brasiliense]|uniref:hypothetical protein n=1 Tax=Pectobacterium brasiliense TaxID=180957 RepID=UPI001969546A|nr:hypothetical protein [Pectobacterium brasiliense]MBN3161614.1 hypothetical protein [Pectobacterium brasiliense]